MVLVAKRENIKNTLLAASFMGAAAGCNFWFTDILTLPFFIGIFIYFAWEFKEKEKVRIAIQGSAAVLLSYLAAWSIKWVLALPVIGTSAAQDAVGAILTRTGNEAWKEIYWYSGIEATFESYSMRPGFPLISFIVSVIIILILTLKSKKRELKLSLFAIGLAVLWMLVAKQHLFIHAELFGYKIMATVVAIIISLGFASLFTNKLKAPTGKKASERMLYNLSRESSKKIKFRTHGGLR